VELQHHLAALQAHGAVVLAASLDPVATSRALAGRMHLLFPILQDTGGSLGAAFGDYQNAGGHAQDGDAIVILDAQGHMRWGRFGGGALPIAASTVQDALAGV
jgi:peroxiredoxin